MAKGILGKKIGMTQIFEADGRLIPVTVVEAGPCVVVQNKTEETDGYNAVQLGFGEIKEKHIKELMGKRSVFELTYNNNLLTIKYNKGKNNLEELISYLKENKIKYNRIFSERPTLNDVFLELTGKELRD